MSLEFKISGIVFEKESRKPLPNLIVRAYDKDLLFDDLLGDASTNNSGYFELRYSKKDFKELFENKPDIYFRIYDPSSNRAIHVTANSVRWNAGADEYFEIAIPKRKLPSFREDTLLLDGWGRVRTEFEVGDNLLINLQKLSPQQSYTIRLLAESIEVFNVSLVSDRYGRIEPTVLWPDIGIGIPRKGGRYAYENFDEALKEMANLRFTIEILEKKNVIRTVTFTIKEIMEQLRLYPISKKGNLQRGLVLGRDDVRIHGRNFPSGAIIDLFLVERQYQWRVGNPIIPIRNLDRSEVIQRIRLSAEESEFTSTLWAREQVRPGRYDVIARVVIEHEFRADERILREADIVSERLITTLVVRDNIYRTKPVYMGCDNAMEIAGKFLSGAPYFMFTNNFPIGTPVRAALDPLGISDDVIGKKVRYYVVEHKSDEEWSLDNSLTDVTGTISEVIVSSSCINYNAETVWDDPQQKGKYDLVADLGNNDPNPALFEADDQFNSPIDMIDGYFVVGFHVTEDPSLPGTQFKAGKTTYDEPAVTIPAVGVWCDWEPDCIWGDTPDQELSLPLRAEVRYPADEVGNDVSVSEIYEKYPLIVVMHGMHTSADPSYEGYTYLLDHLATHGYIAVSIDCNVINDINGNQDTRGYAMLEHLLLLQSMNDNPGLFEGKIDMDKILIMGHSRGGDGVVQAEIYNQTLGYGFNILGVVALAPTDFSGTSPNPLILTTSKFLCIYGSNDGDVRGKEGPATQYTGTGFRFYDRATVEKAMVFIYGATHNRFNTEWDIEWRVDTSSPKVLSRGIHELLLCGYMTAFAQYCLHDLTEQIDYFTGELKIPQVAEVEVHSQYRPITSMRHTVDHFEIYPELDKNSLGGDVTYNNLAGTPEENLLGALNINSPHQTRGLKLKWNNTTATYQTKIPLPEEQRNISEYKFMSFRVTQTVDPDANPQDQPQDFYVRLSTANGGNSRAVRVGYFQTIPYPYKPEFVASVDWEEGHCTKSAMKTVRIPLHAWTIKSLSAPKVDLANVESITFEFLWTLKGEILIDEIEFTKI